MATTTIYPCPQNLRSVLGTYTLRNIARIIDHAAPATAHGSSIVQRIKGERSVTSVDNYLGADHSKHIGRLIDICYLSLRDYSISSGEPRDLDGNDLPFFRVEFARLETDKGRKLLFEARAVHSVEGTVYEAAPEVFDKSLAANAKGADYRRNFLLTLVRTASRGRLPHLAFS